MNPSKLLILIWLLPACYGTRINKLSSSARLNSESKIAILPVKGIYEIDHQVLDIARRKLSIPDSAIYSLDLIMYDIINSGISKESIFESPLNAETKRMLKENFGIDYFIEIIVGNLQEGDSDYYYTNELRTASYDKNSSIASIIFNVFNVDQLSPEASFSVKTEIQSWDFGDQDELRVNLSNDKMALSKAIQKGFKQINKGLVRLDNP